MTEKQSARLALGNELIRHLLGEVNVYLIAGKAGRPTLKPALLKFREDNSAETKLSEDAVTLMAGM